MTEYTSSGQKWVDDPAQGIVGELYAEISRELGTDGPADTFGHPDESAVGHLVGEDDRGADAHVDSDVLASDSHDLEDLSAEERAMHLVDPDDLDADDSELGADARARLDDF